MALAARLILTGALLLTAVAALAQRPTADTRQTDYGPCIYETIDACFHNGDWWYEGTSIDGGYRYNVTTCGLTEGCKACGITNLGKPICVNVLYNAACKCKVEPVPDAGPNIVMCSDEGQCEVRR